MKIRLISILLALAFVFSIRYAAAAQLELSFGTRIDIRTAQFLWNVEGDASALSNFILMCGPASGSYSDAIVLDKTARSYPASSIITKSAIYYCVLDASDGKFSIASSNEVVLELKGRWLTRLD